MNLRAEVDSYTKSNFNPTIDELITHLEEAICNSLDDLSREVCQCSGPGGVLKLIRTLQEEIKADESAEPTE